MIRVLLVDDHPVVHDGVAAVLNRTPDIRLVQAVENLENALAALEGTKPDVALLDVRLRGADSLSAIGTLVAARPALRVIVFSAYDVDEYVFGAIRAGARGYLLKGAAGAELATAIRKVHGGESYLSPQLSTKLVDEMQTRSRGSRLLTPRESVVLRLMAAGLSNKEIAGSLGITERTVKFHVTGVLNKLGAENRTQAVALAGRRGILPIDQA
ncbi:MAG: LuxR C-terminal-related transcriptional regulator [Vicinamibacterales bacterium]